MQRRRFLFSAALAAPLLTTACSGQSVPRNISLSTLQLQQRVASKFPRTFPVAGLLQLELMAPTLTMLPEVNQIKALLPAQLTGKVLKQNFQGQMEVSFGLRYVAADRTVRAHGVRIHSLQIQDAPEALSDMLATYSPRVGEQLLENFVLHQLEEKDLALADSMGIEPGAITVMADGLSVALQPRKSGS